MGPDGRRFAVALSVAVAAHGLLLAGLMGRTPDIADPGDRPLRVTRSVAPAATRVADTVLAAQDQRGWNDRSQRARRTLAASAPQRRAAQGPAAAQVTRYLIIAERPSGQLATGTARPVPAQSTPRPGLARNARGDARAAYLSRWQTRIETLGNRALPNTLLGGRDRRLTLAVRMAPDGTLRSARIVQSSGRRALDTAALRLVRTAAPYPPFDPGLAGANGELRFAYDWLFEAGGAARLRAPR